MRSPPPVAGFEGVEAEKKLDEGRKPVLPWSLQKEGTLASTLISASLRLVGLLT